MIAFVIIVIIFICIFWLFSIINKHNKKEEQKRINENKLIEKQKQINENKVTEEKNENFNNNIKKLENTGFKCIENNLYLNKDGDCYLIDKSKLEIIKQSPVLIKNVKYPRYGIIIDTISGSKILFMHRIVAENFCENPKNYNYVKRINKNIKNYKSSNLEWTDGRNPKVKQKVTKVSKVKQKNHPNKQNFKIKDNTWLEFILNNFTSGVNVQDISEIIANKAKEKNFSSNSQNFKKSVYNTISLYSQKNINFHFFTIREDLNNTVYLEKNHIKPYISK